MNKKISQFPLIVNPIGSELIPVAFNGLNYIIYLSAITETSFSNKYLPLSGGTVSGDTTFTSGLTANTISASTYLNLPLDVRITGGTYSDGVLSLNDNSGSTINISGFTADIITGGTYSGGTLVLTNTTGGTISVSGFSYFLYNETLPNSIEKVRIRETIFNPCDLEILETSIFIIEETACYYVLGDLTNRGVIEVNGTLKVGGEFYNYGIITGSGIIE